MAKSGLVQCGRSITVCLTRYCTWFQRAAVGCCFIRRPLLLNDEELEHFCTHTIAAFAIKQVRDMWYYELKSLLRSRASWSFHAAASPPHYFRNMALDSFLFSFSPPFRAFRASIRKLFSSASSWWRSGEVLTGKEDGMELPNQSAFGFLRRRKLKHKCRVDFCNLAVLPCTVSLSWLYLRWWWISGVHVVMV